MIRCSQLISFVIIGAGASAITFVVTWFAVALNQNLLLGGAIAAMAGTCFSFIGNARFTFSSKISTNKALKFITVYALTGIFYSVLFEYFFSGLSLLSAFLISITITTVINFLAQRLWIFR